MELNELFITKNDVREPQNNILIKIYRDLIPSDDQTPNKKL